MRTVELDGSSAENDNVSPSAIVMFLGGPVHLTVTSTGRRATRTASIVLAGADEADTSARAEIVAGAAMT